MALIQLEQAMIKHLEKVVRDFVPLGVESAEFDRLNKSKKYALEVYGSQYTGTRSNPNITVIAEQGDRDVDTGNINAQITVQIIYHADDHKGLTDPVVTLNQISDSILESLENPKAALDASGISGLMIFGIVDAAQSHGSIDETLTIYRQIQITLHVGIC